MRLVSVLSSLIVTVMLLTVGCSPPPAPTEMSELAPSHACALDSCSPLAALSETIAAGEGPCVLLIEREAGSAGDSNAMRVTRRSRGRIHS